jgi:hypothetical protein
MIDRFKLIIENFAAQNLPNGKLELLDENDIKLNGLINDMPLFPLITNIHIEKQGNHFIFSKITNQLIIGLTAPTNGSNIGKLKNIIKRASQEIRSAAIQTVN